MLHFIHHSPTHNAVRILLSIWMIFPTIQLFAQYSMPPSHAAVCSAEQFLHSNTLLPVPELQENIRSMEYSAASLLKRATAASTLRIADFPVSLQEQATVLLQRVRPSIDATTQVWISAPDGDKALSLPQIMVFRGTIEGEAGSRVTLCLANNELIASVHHADGRAFSITPSKENAKGRSSITHYCLPEGFFQATKPDVQYLSCMSDDLRSQMQSLLSTRLPQRKGNALQSDKLLELKIAVEADTKFYQDFGKDSLKAATYAAALISLASVMYEDELHVTLFIPWIKIWSENPADPYNVKGDGYQLAWKAKDYWKKNNIPVKRDLVHVLTSGGGGGIGLQYPLNDGGGGTTICSNDDGFASSSPFTDHTFPTLNFTYGVYIVAHEIGHNFGAVHSHNCYWNPPFDTCVVDEGITGKCFPSTLTTRPNPGSIMSYCPSVNLKAHNNDFAYYRVNMTFLPRIAAYMRAQVEQAPCISEPAKPTIILISPRGYNSSINDTSIKIHWLSARVQYVNLEYSTNGGASWEGIVADIAAASLSHRWYLPVINTNTMLVRAYDATNPFVADTSVVSFKVQNTVGVEEEDALLASGLRIQSGITHQHIRLDATLPLTTSADISLFNPQGMEVRCWHLLPSTALVMQSLDVSDLSAGAYYIRVRIGEQYRFISIIKD